MTDPANATNIAITGRLKAACLLALAERVAKRHDLLLHHVIAVGGDPTGGHVALWRALAAEGKDAAALAAILGWPAAVIEKHVPTIPEAPKSGPRLVKPRVRRDLQRQALQPVLGMVDATLTSLRSLRAEVKALDARLVAALSEFEKVRAAIDGSVSADRTSQEALAITHTRAHGDESGIVEGICRDAAISIALLLTGSVDRKVCAVRRRCVVALTEAGQSRAAVARILGVRPAAIWQHLAVAAKAAA